MINQLCKQIDAGEMVANLLLEAEFLAPASIVEMPGIGFIIQGCHICKNVRCLHKDIRIKMLGSIRISISILFHEPAEDSAYHNVAPLLLFVV